MKTLKQLSEEEQQEARYAEAVRRFRLTMQRIQEEHRRAHQRIDRNGRLAQWAVIAIGAIGAGIVLVTWLWKLWVYR